MPTSKRRVASGRDKTAALTTLLGRMLEDVATRAGCTTQPECPCKMCAGQRAADAWFEAQPPGSLVDVLSESLARVHAHASDDTVDF